MDSTSIDPHAFPLAVDRVRTGTATTAAAEQLYRMLTDQERLALLHGDVDFWPGRGRIMEHGYSFIPFQMGRNDRLGIPGIRFIDGPRGVMVGHATAFPVSMARGATWDPSLERRVGAAIGRELRASGGNLFGGVCINLPRHPAWGRAQETYSEQPLLLGQMGAALVTGVKPNAMACVKHYALNSMENARFDVDVQCDDATLHEDFLPHFKTAIEAGAESVMCAYNSINGEWASANAHLLTDVLREQWGFDGFVMSDFIWATRDAVASLKAGLDLEAPFKQLRGENLPEALERGEVTWDDVHTSAIRILSAQLAHYAQRETGEPDPAIIAGTEHRRLAREVSRRSLVLLRNQTDASGSPALPLTNGQQRIAVIGRLADQANLGDKGSSNVHPPEVITLLDGLREQFTDATIIHDDGADPERAAAVAAECDAAVVVVGYTAAEEGEWVNGRVYARDDLMALYPPVRTDVDQAVFATMMARLEQAKGKPEAGGDRKSLRLLPEDEALVHAICAANARTIVILEAAGAVIIEAWDDEPAAIVLAWYPGMEGGRAIAEMLAGAEDFSGRLPFSIPSDECHLPEFRIDAHEITYDRWYGQRKLAHDGHEAAYPLGFGLSRAEHHIEQVDIAGVDSLSGRANVTVRNASEIASRCVVQLYATRLNGDRANERELVGFASLNVPALTSTTEQITFSLQPLTRWNPADKRLDLPAGPVSLEAARYWGDPTAPSTTFTI